MTVATLREKLQECTDEMVVEISDLFGRESVSAIGIDDKQNKLIIVAQSAYDGVVNRGDFVEGL